MWFVEKLIDLRLIEIFESKMKELYLDKNLKPVEITVATDEKFGDYQSNFAMINSKIIGKNPKVIAEEVINSLEKNDIIEKLEIAGPGFINIYLIQLLITTLGIGEHSLENSL